MTRARTLSLLGNENNFTVTGSNNVGIGSTLPDAKLDVGGDILVGTAITLGNVSGIISAISYRGDGSQLTGVDSSNLIDSGDTNRVAANTSGIVVTGIATVTGNMNVGGVLTYDDVTNVDSLGIITARSHVSIADSILHTGDTDTSIRFPSANTFTVETGGSEALRVDSSQRLLVGTTSFTGEASAVLEGSSAGDNVQAQLWLNRGAANPVVDLLLGMINFGDSDAEGHMGAKIDVRTDGNWSSGNYPSRLMFHTTASSASSPTERLRITSGGNIGINSTDPTSYGNSQATLVVEDTISPALCISDTGQARDWFIIGQGDGLAINYADGGGSGSASNVTGSMFLRNNGNIGINESTPGAKLHIVDTMQATANGHNQLLILGDDSGTDGESASIYMSAINATNRGLSLIHISEPTRRS